MFWTRPRYSASSWASVESFGEYRPVASNDPPEGRALNRRVEIFYARDDIVAEIAALAAKAEAGAVTAEDVARIRGGG